jgi:hypothetical protein
MYRLFGLVATTLVSSTSPESPTRVAHAGGGVAAWDQRDRGGPDEHVAAQVGRNQGVRCGGGAVQTKPVSVRNQIGNCGPLSLVMQHATPPRFHANDDPPAANSPNRSTPTFVRCILTRCMARAWARPLLSLNLVVIAGLSVASTLRHCSRCSACYCRRACLRCWVRVHFFHACASLCMCLRACVNVYFVGGWMVIYCAVRRLQAVAQLQQKLGAIVIPPYDHVDVMTGQGTLALEFMEQTPGLDAVVVPTWVPHSLMCGTIASALSPSCRPAKIVVSVLYSTNTALI